MKGGMPVSYVFWLLFLAYTLVPMLRQRMVEHERIRLIRELEKKRGTRVIVMIHRQESISLLGLPISRYINIEDSEQVLRAIRLTPDDMPIDIILHTPGGLVLAAEQIAMAIKGHPAKVCVFVPHYAMSGGTMLALAADEINMDENAVLGPVDPQLGSYPAVSLLKVLQRKDINKVDDETLVLADIAEKAIDQVRKTVYEIIKPKMEEEEACRIARLFTEGKWTHDYPIDYDELKSMGLPVNKGIPRQIYQLMELYPQPQQRRPSVQYVPVPYEGNKPKNRG